MAAKPKRKTTPSQARTSAGASRLSHEKSKPDSLAKLQAEVVKFCKDRDWDQFHAPKNVAMALAIEASEVMEPMRWMSEKESWQLDQGSRQQIKDEIGDVMFCLLNLCYRLHIDPIEACTKKLVSSAIKYPVETSRGNAKKYSGAKKAPKS